MNIIAHRGFWNHAGQKNSLAALTAAIDKNWGIETDIRDYCGKLVISHDIPNAQSPLLETFLEYYADTGHDSVLALNIKADGLQKLLLEQIEKFNIRNYFIFDMSIPEFVQYRKYNINTFSRQSEYESVPNFYRESSGIWLDEFEHHWISASCILEHQENDKQICIVSPELHGRSHVVEWKLYKSLDTKELMICTDLPELAEEFFNG